MRESRLKAAPIQVGSNEYAAEGDVMDQNQPFMIHWKSEIADAYKKLNLLRGFIFPVEAL